MTRLTRALATLFWSTALCTAALAADVEPQTPPTGAPTWVGQRWPNGVIPYVIDTNATWSDFHCNQANPDNKPGPQRAPINARQMNAIVAALQEYSTVTPVRFEKHDTNNPPPAGTSYLLFFSDNWARASAAETRGMPTDGSVNCLSMQLYPSSGPGPDPDEDLHARRGIKHELGHVMGFAHEQQRADREGFIAFPSCETRVSTQDKLMGKETGPLLTPYDYDSIMQYASNNGCEPGCGPCMAKTSVQCLTDPNWGTLSPTDCAWIDTPTELSVHDVNALYRMYERTLDTEQRNDAYGTSFAVGDFDGDGYQDLAIGAPGDGPRGLVYLLKGTAGGKPGSRGRLVNWMVLSPPPFDPTAPFAPQVGRFGATLAAGHFNDDERGDDLAVGAPGGSDGTVFLYKPTAPSIKISPTAFADSPRLVPTFWRFLNQSALGQGFGSAGDHFGAALAAGDFDRDGLDDLAIGVPDKLVKGYRSGEVLVTLSGASFNAAKAVTPRNAPGTVRVKDLTGAHFGASLLAGHLNPTGDVISVAGIRPRIDLAVGATEDLTDTGAVYVFEGDGLGGLTGRQVLRPDATSTPRIGMRFGTALAGGNFASLTTPSGHPIVQLAVGAPFANRPAAEAGGTGTSAAGAVNFFTSPDPSALSFVASTVVYEPAAAARRHFGRALGTWHANVDNFVSDVLLAGAPDGGHGTVTEVFLIPSGQGGMSPHATALPAPAGLATGDRLGAAFATGDFLPNDAGGPGLDEIVVGAPGRNNAAGMTFVKNADRDVWNAYRESVAHPE